MNRRFFRRPTEEDEGFAIFLEGRVSMIHKYIVDEIEDAADWDYEEQVEVADSVLKVADLILAHIAARPIPQSLTLTAVREDLQLALNEYRLNAVNWLSGEGGDWIDMTSLLAESRLRVAVLNLKDFAPW